MDLGWFELIPRARAGEPSALEEVQFALGPWAHGVILAVVDGPEAGALAEQVVSRVLTAAETPPDALALLAVLLDEARAAAKRARPPPVEVVPVTDAQKALRALRRMGAVAAERAVLRLVEGLSGPDLAHVLRATTESVRDDLAQAVRLALVSLQVEAQVELADPYLWALEGSLPPHLGALEMKLSTLRHDWSTAAMPVSKVSQLAPARATPDVGVNLFPVPGGDGDGDRLTQAVVDLPAEGQLEKTPATPVLPVKPVAPSQTLVEDETTVPTGQPLRPLPVQARPTPAPAPSGPRRRRTLSDVAAVPSLMDEPEPATPDAQENIATRHFSALAPQNRRTTLYVGAASLGLSALCAWAALHSISSNVGAGWPLVPTVVLAVDVPEGTVLTHDMLAMREVPVNYASQLVNPAAISLVLGRQVLVARQSGDPLLWGILDPRTWSKLKVQKKARAYTVSVAGAQGVGDMVVPLDHVDLLVATNYESVRATRTAMENVIVLAAGKQHERSLDRVKRSEVRYTNLTLQMIPEEAEQLALAAATSGFHVTLRQPDDLYVKEDRTVTECSLNGPCQLLEDVVRRTILANKRTRLIEVIRNGSKP